MKKLTVFLMSMMLVLSLSACGGNQQQSSAATPPTASVSEAASIESSAVSESSSTPAEASSEAVSSASPAEASSEAESSAPPIEASSEAESSTPPVEASSEAETPEAEGGKTLVVYYSATGNTEETAGYIAAALDADLFELLPTEPYSSADLNYGDDGSRVVYEHEHPEEREIELAAATVGNWAEYDTVLIGYPIWWGIAAWPVDGFIKANDFTGKTVVPFATSASSGLGESGTLLAEMAGTGNWLSGVRFSSGASEETVRDWALGLGL